MKVVKHKRHKTGFTIVELLIVIVVIAILAVITIVAYNGIQTRANNTQTIRGVKEFIKAYNAYATEKGDYPTGTGCLGEGYPGGRCLSQQTVNSAVCWSTGSATENSLNATFKQYLGGRLPSVSMQGAECGSTTYIGAYGAYNMTTKAVTILMILKGDQTCPSMSMNTFGPSKLFTDNATRCAYTLAAVSL